MEKYIKIIKPKIILGNLISFSGGFFFGSQYNINYLKFITVLLGIFCVIISSCLINNYLDKDIDKKMERTKERTLILNNINLKIYLFYSVLLMILGVFIIFISTNILTMILSLIGYFIYIFIYTIYMKRKSIYSIIIGSLSGSIPPLIGYCSVTNKFDFKSFILSIIFILWQIPHSYSISIFRLKDYKNANIPTFPIIKGIHKTKIHILIYILLFSIITMFFFINEYVGYKYAIVTTLINFIWIKHAITGFNKKCKNKIWAKKIFFLSIITIILFNIMISIDLKNNLKENYY